MKLVLISDTHDRRPRSVPDGDCLIHTGDFACGDDFASLRRDVDWFQSFPHKHKLLTDGNHDLVLKNYPNSHKLLAPILFLSNRGVELDGIHFYGIAWGSKPFIPSGTDVLLSHMPPAGVLDGGSGSRELQDAIAHVQPRLVVFGHAHGCRGHIKLGHTDFYNATLDEPTTDVVGAMSHTIKLPAGQPWVHELELEVLCG